jgi:hypothetical protein
VRLRLLEQSMTTKPPHLTEPYEHDPAEPDGFHLPEPEPSARKPKSKRKGEESEDGDE